MKFYGTSAAEGIPSPFCRCRVCENAREVGGKEIRRRTMFRVNEKVCIDMGADFFQQSVEYGDFYELEHLIVTHTHEDHFAHMLMNIRAMAFSRSDKTLNIYFTDKAYDIVEFYRTSSPIIKGLTASIEKQGIIAFHKLEFDQEYTIDSLLVTPYRGNHFGNMKEYSANYLLILPNQSTMYYGLDTGWYLEETFASLTNKKIDILVSECTMGIGDDTQNPKGHMNATSNLHLFNKLLEIAAITTNTKIYLTHINQFSTHQDLVSFYEKQKNVFAHPLTVTYDGFEIPM